MEFLSSVQAAYNKDATASVFLPSSWIQYGAREFGIFQKSAELIGDTATTTSSSATSSMTSLTTSNDGSHHSTDNTDDTISGGSGTNGTNDGTNVGTIIGSGTNTNDADGDVTPTATLPDTTVNGSATNTTIGASTTLPVDEEKETKKDATTASTGSVIKEDEQTEKKEKTKPVKSRIAAFFTAPTTIKAAKISALILALLAIFAGTAYAFITVGMSHPATIVLGTASILIAVAGLGYLAYKTYKYFKAVKQPTTEAPVNSTATITTATTTVVVE